METARVVSLGWFLPRSQNAEASAIFYGRVFRLPLLRGYADAWLLWAGETVVFEPKSDGGPKWRYPDWSTSPALPVFRTFRLQDFNDRLRRFDVRIVARGDDLRGEYLVIEDADRHYVMIRQSSSTDELVPDSLARHRRERWDAMTSFNPGVPPMPSDLQGLDCVIRHVEDLLAMRTFYESVVGLSCIYADEVIVVLDCGDGTTLELRRGGVAEAVPADRYEIPDAFILRVNDFKGYSDKLRSHDVTFVNDTIQFGRGALRYFCDPEGHLIGYEERYDQGECRDGAVAFAEDVEANRRSRLVNEAPV